MFKSDNKPKNAFLQKKNQEKAKAAEQQKHKAQIATLQNNIRAFLTRRKILNSLDLQQSIPMKIIMKKKLL